MKKMIALLIFALLVLSGCANYRAPWENNPYVRLPSTIQDASRIHRIESPILSLPKEIPLPIEQAELTKPINTGKTNQTGREVKKVEKIVTPSTKAAALQTKNKSTDTKPFSAPAAPKKLNIPID